MKNALALTYLVTVNAMKPRPEHEREAKHLASRIWGMSSQRIEPIIAQALADAEERGKGFEKGLIDVDLPPDND